MVDHARARKLAERVKVLAAEALEKVVKDPDLGFVTITDARVTPDLMDAKIYFTVFGSAEDLERTKEILERNKGKIRSEIGRQLSIRLTPTIEFLHDEVPSTAGALNDLLAEAKRRDAEVEALAKTAKPAGEADPYVKPKEL
ncbi:MAG: ribosome-binding factor RbfA [Actinomycetota bacterium]|jgi:ribosome-binding factor A